MHRILVVSVLLAAASAPAAHAQVEYGNVVPVTVPAPKADEVVLARVQVGMEISRKARPRPRSIGPLTARRVGGIPRGYAVNGVTARLRGNRVVVRLAAVRLTGGRVRPRLRLRVRVGTRRAAFTSARISAVAIDPDTRVRRQPECSRIGREAEGWSRVRGLAGVRIGGERFGARTTVGAVQQLACRRAIDAVPVGAAERFLVAVHPAFASAGIPVVEGFFATWARLRSGTAVVCVFVRGRAGGTGDVTVGTPTQSFTLDEDRGLAITVTPVPGDGEYLLRVRWRQPDGSFRDTESTIRVPTGGARGNDPPRPYSAAGSCGD